MRVAYLPLLLLTSNSCCCCYSAVIIWNFFLDISSFGSDGLAYMQHEAPHTARPAHHLLLPAVNFCAADVAAAAAWWTRLPKCFVLFCFGNSKSNSNRRAKYFCYHCNLSRNVGVAVLFAFCLCPLAPRSGLCVRSVRTCC